MTTHLCDLSPSDEQPESARELLWRHGLPEDVLDGALALHAQELAAVQRREAAVWGVDTAAGKHILAAADLIDPTRSEAAAAPAVSSVGGAALRDRIAEALTGAYLTASNDSAIMDVLADAVLAVLPAPADRAAVLTEGAQALLALRDRLIPEPDVTGKYLSGLERGARELRRLAGGAAPNTGTEARQPVRHAPGKVVLCPDCRAKGHAACMADSAQGEVIHGFPPDGSGVTPCCGRTPFELPHTDRMSGDPDAVTCQGGDSRRG